MHFDMDLKGKAKDKTNCKAVLNYEEENEITIIGYRLVKWKWFLTMIVMVGSAGLLWLLLYWIPKWKLLWTHEQVRTENSILFHFSSGFSACCFTVK